MCLHRAGRYSITHTHTHTEHTPAAQTQQVHLLASIQGTSLRLNSVSSCLGSHPPPAPLPPHSLVFTRDAATTSEAVACRHNDQMAAVPTRPLHPCSSVLFFYQRAVTQDNPQTLLCTKRKVVPA